MPFDKFMRLLPDSIFPVYAVPAGDAIPGFSVLKKKKAR
jgi:hypothetical protein